MADTLESAKAQPTLDAFLASKFGNFVAFVQTAFGAEQWEEHKGKLPSNHIQMLQIAGQMREARMRFVSLIDELPLWEKDVKVSAKDIASNISRHPLAMVMLSQCGFEALETTPDYWRKILRYLLLFVEQAELVSSNVSSRTPVAV